MGFFLRYSGKQARKVVEMEKVGKAGKAVAVKSVELGDIRLRRRLEWLAGGFMDRAVEIVQDEECIGILVGPEFLGVVRALGEAWSKRESPFTQADLDRWREEALAKFEVGDVLVMDG